MKPVQNKDVNIINLGLKDYKETWDYQTDLFDTIVKRKIENRKGEGKYSLPTNNYLIFCEHPHVFTLGKSGDEANLLISADELKDRKASFYKINRGGDITYHGPGQLVGYPILDLENFFTDIHKYLRLLEEAIIRTLKDFGIYGERYEGLTGVWIEPGTPRARKICAMGVKSGRWVTMHGFALNINTDLSYFNYIVPCGIDDKAVTSMERELNRNIPLKEVSGIFVNHFKDVFEINIFIAETEL